MPPARAEVLPTVLWRRDEHGLRERCELHLELGGPFEGELRLEVAGERFLFPHEAAPFGHLRLGFGLPDGPPEAAWALPGLGLSGTLRRRRKWRVHVTPHVHTDVG